ncbi:copper amine oxidase N-terminal domain-containing protein [Cytobacillus depressus]|uniref:Copper amine oxidase N-terminal domain-containing protein n=1 Tax=Cytobacillus depressus TaxID=1602942 RepID=A0A6L3V8U9_9BACI|nr:copper amine oxidase N-terminal domain-containing protein [Cytobacillus depressus]KAB2336765.1 copper amine oxidase N-terminal domain-containing protein [Cytobacillus depressus]
MIRKAIKLMAVFVLLLGLAMPASSSAAGTEIKIIIDGRVISVDQPPIIQNGRTLVPLRSIFEGLQAVVDYNSKTKVITAQRGSTTIELTLGSKSAKINGKSVQLDVPAQALNNRTLVPVRFVSEALGDDVYYDSYKRTVEIKTKNNGVSNLAVKDINDYGDGRDLQVSFTKAKNDAQIDHYRGIVVKTSNLSNFNVNKAMSLAANRYLLFTGGGQTQQKTFTYSSLDSDGDSIQNDIDYTIFVISVNKNNVILGYESAKLTLKGKYTVKPVTGPRLKDVSDFGDGRDLEVSFNKIADEYDLLLYQAIVVRADEAKAFNLSAALELPAANYTAISKTGANISQNLSSWTRDSKGRLIQSGIAYNVFILSVGNPSRSFSSALSAPSNAITLNSNPEEIRISKLAVKDTFDYGDGRDLQVSFTAPTNDSRVSEYRIFVVREADVKNFTLSRAENTSSSYYTSVSKSAYKDISINLSANARDVSGYYVQNDTPYKVFVLSVGSLANSYKNTLSTASSTIKLTNNQIANAVTNLVTKDVSDWGDGRDLEVSFNKVSDESKVSEYRIMVVKSSQASSFNLNSANSTNYYTRVPKTGANIKTVLNSNSRDVYGEMIREDVEYKVFVLTVSSGGNSSNNALSAASSIKLRDNTTTLAATNVIATDIGNLGDGRDLEVKFTKATDESAISEYRIMVVKSSDVPAFDLAKANQVSSNNYTRVVKTGKDITVVLGAHSRDTSGTLITTGQKYRVFVLSVSSTGKSNALSNASAEFSLSHPEVQKASNVTANDIANNGNGSDLEVSFTKAGDESNIAYYDILVVNESNAGSFDLSKANVVPVENRTRVNKDSSGNTLIKTLAADARDVNGQIIRNGVSYQIFILSIADGVGASINALSTPSTKITLN